MNRLSGPVRWGIVGCGDVTEVKSGPGFQRAEGSALTAVMRRDRAKAEDYARRHGVARAYDDAGMLIADGDVDAVYIATPPDTHEALAVRVAAAGKPCLVEKPMARSHAECRRMIDAFARAGVPLWVAYYRRALPRFLTLRELLRSGAIGQVTSVHVQVTDRLARGEAASNWRFDPARAGAGLFFDLASHCVDLLDFLFGPIADACGFPLNTGGTYAAEDVTNAAYRFDARLSGTGTWNFNAAAKTDVLAITGTDGTIAAPIFADTDLVVTRADGERQTLPVRNPAHVHQPLIQTIVDELRGRGRCESTAESGARASWVMDRCLGRATR
ncbi:MAG TPA: Gfo/Idh/MocA family oxidoreductase [Vicinamibacterales bacterium]|nr:Gfo/Idh/MocA family oxidoreductase [Vicinamibacterales bacterium]